MLIFVLFRWNQSYFDLVLLNQILRSKDNEWRLNKAARSPQHRNKEVGTTKRCQIYCTRQEQVSSSTIVRLVFTMTKNFMTHPNHSNT